MSSPKGHVVLFSYEGWGHLRPLTVLAAKIVKTRTTHVTVLTNPKYLERVQTEVSRNFDSGDATRDLIRVIAMPIPDNSTMINPAGINTAFVATYKQLVNGESIKCAQSGTVHNPLPIPTAVVLDFFAKAPLDAVRAAHSVKAYAWYTGSASFISWAFGSDGEDPLPKIEAKVKETGRSFSEVAAEVVFETTGQVLYLPGLPPMHDYEHQPQEMFVKGIGGQFMLDGRSFLEQCDGLIMTTPEEYEPEGIADIKKWFAKTSRSVYHLGPLLPALNDPKVSAEEKSISANGQEISDFMDSVLKSHGPQSMVYMAFGSIFWSVEPEKIWAFVDVLIEKKIPFVMSHASPFASVPDSMKEKVEKSGLGILSKFTPQHSILAHPVTGWFVTHCGQNSTIETIAYGIPMICWPFSADQPANAARLTDILDVAYELYEIRNGLGLKPILRNGKVPVGTVEAVREEAARVLENAFLADGQRKRENLKKLREAILGSWSDGGSSRLSMDALADALDA
ncbi:hypothetical protein NLI96_g3558 [Meripilus lineatus]|uniref:Uncharacterized protein n=1 Tax=Meripilus lineatus TaxID=2056292 RepID=A0AAD5YGG6_9APHY|nr:hypothetical protein NLI96_g3558 [Physisporinus lineatus]